jgi:hypothetical protein
VDFAQQHAVAAVTVRVDAPRAGAERSSSDATFLLHKADDRWQIVDLAGLGESRPGSITGGR